MMSSEIYQTLNTYLYREQRLLDQYYAYEVEIKSQSSSLVRKGVSIGVGELASWVFESSKVGRYGRNLTKQYLDLQIKEQQRERERTFENQHNVTVQSLRTYLESISIKRKSIKEPNSQRILAKLDKAQTFVKLPTRIRRTTEVLIDLTSKYLIFNTEIPETILEEIILNPGEPEIAFLEIKKRLGSATKFVNIIDPYIGQMTLDLLLSVAENIPIKVVTAYTGGKNFRRFMRDCKTFKLERPTFFIRKCDPSLIHDRFILTDSNVWNVGTSIKDVGKSLSMIKQLTPTNTTKMHRFFEGLWRDSIALDI